MNQSVKANPVGPRRLTDVACQALYGFVAAFFLIGCAKIPRSLDEVGPRYKPSNIYHIADFLPPELRRVAVLPLTTPNSKAVLSAGVDTLETTVYAELEKTGRFEVIPVSREQLREWTGQASWKADEALPRDILQRMREGTGCDGVLFCQLSRYPPYEPMAIGWKFELVDEGGSGEVMRLRLPPPRRFAFCGRLTKYSMQVTPRWPRLRGYIIRNTFGTKRRCQIHPPSWARPADLASTR